jgi:hypothetical protein
MIDMSNDTKIADRGRFGHMSFVLKNADSKAQDTQKAQKGKKNSPEFALSEILC